MTAPVFLAPADALATAGAGATVVLEGAEGHHAATVRRLRVGEPVELVDGCGVRLAGVVAEVGRDRLHVVVSARADEPAPSPRLVVVQALAKGDRGELAVETLTEVGVDVIVPWAAARSVVRWRADRVDRGLERWRATAREAAKQARRSWFPQVSGVAGTDEVVTLLAVAAVAVVLHEEAPAALGGLPVPGAGDVVLVVGPEGGIDQAELDAFSGPGKAQLRRLGPTVLRTSTAGAVGAAVLLAASPRWAAPDQR